MASIRQYTTKDGMHYKITVCSGRDVHGKQIRHYKNWTPPPGMTARQIEKEVKRIAYEFEQSLSYGFQPDNRQTFKEYAAYCIEMREQRGDKPQTIERAKRQTERINEYIGHMRLVDIRPAHLNRMYQAMMQPGAVRWNVFAVPALDFRTEILQGQSTAAFAEKCGTYARKIWRVCNGEPITLESAAQIEKALGRTDLFIHINNDKPMSPGTIRSYHGTVCAVFSQAYKEMIISFNPAERATLPKKKPVRETRSLEPEELQAVIRALDSERLQFKALVLFMICTGCRRGEAIALDWTKIDWQRGEVVIDQSAAYTARTGIIIGTTKTDDRRVIALPREMLSVLREHQKKQTEQRTILADYWKPSNLVFTRWDGQILNPDAINVELNEFSKRHDLPHLNPHMFRHTAASLLLSNGVDVLTVSKMLGHKDVTTTTETYAHEIAAARRKTAECISEILLNVK